MDIVPAGTDGLVTTALFVWNHFTLAIAVAVTTMPSIEDTGNRSNPEPRASW